MTLLEISEGVLDLEVNTTGVCVCVVDIQQHRACSDGVTHNTTLRRHSNLGAMIAGANYSRCTFKRVRAGVVG